MVTKHQAPEAGLVSQSSLFWVRVASVKPPWPEYGMLGRSWMGDVLEAGGLGWVPESKIIVWRSGVIAGAAGPLGDLS